MKLTEFQFDCPNELIAQYPSQQRTDSRLLVLDGNTGQRQDRQFNDIITLIDANDLLVINDTKVIPARLLGHKDTGGKIEVLIERILDNQRVLAQIKSSHSPRAGQHCQLESAIDVIVLGRQGTLFELQFNEQHTVMAWLERYGRIPLPPYIEREVASGDKARYQTVYAQSLGAVAAPTAGLHFTESILAQLTAKGVDIATVTLHVGAGTFQSVKVEDIEQHKMHSESIVVSPTVCEKIKATRAKGGRVIAVGTTSLRAIESASATGDISPYHGETDIFIYPGYDFKQVDALITNFHLSQSTLLMLVSAFAGREHILAAYQHAVTEKYRFFSYGDAMFIRRKTD